MPHSRPQSRAILGLLKLALVTAAMMPAGRAMAQGKKPARQPAAPPAAGQPATDPQVAARTDPDAQASYRNLRSMMLGMQNYSDGNKAHFPAAYTQKDGKPLLSWRVALLPYLGDEPPEVAELHAQFKLDEPWDSAHNRQLIDKMPAVYRSPKTKLADGRTRYLTPRGRSTAFPGAEGISLRQITDGHSNTIAIVEVDDEHAVPWTKPDDWTPTADRITTGLDGQYFGGFLAAFCDGHVDCITLMGNDKHVKNLCTIAGGEPPSLQPQQQ